LEINDHVRSAFIYKNSVIPREAAVTVASGVPKDVEGLWDVRGVLAFLTGRRQQNPYHKNENGRTWHKWFLN
jgi:hypothetical protein